MLLRPGNAGSNTSSDHVVVLREALRQLPGHRSGSRAGRSVLVRIDGAGATHKLLDWVAGQRLSYSIGLGRQRRAGPRGRVGRRADRSAGLDRLAGWDAGGRPQETLAPGAQLRITDVDGLRVTAFATNAPPANVPTSSFGSGAGPAAKTGSATPRTGG